MACQLPVTGPGGAWPPDLTQGGSTCHSGTMGTGGDAPLPAAPPGACPLLGGRGAGAARRPFMQTGVARVPPGRGAEPLGGCGDPQLRVEGGSGAAGGRAASRIFRVSPDWSGGGGWVRM